MKIRTKELITKYYLSRALHEKGLFIGGFKTKPEDWNIQVGNDCYRNYIRIAYIGHEGVYDLAAFLRILVDIEDLVEAVREYHYHIVLVAGPVYMITYNATGYKHTPVEEIRKVLKEMGVK